MFLSKYLETRRSERGIYKKIANHDQFRKTPYVIHSPINAGDEKSNSTTIIVPVLVVICDNSRNYGDVHYVMLICLSQNLK